jgi:hypothetical protein
LKDETATENVNGEASASGDSEEYETIAGPARGGFGWRWVRGPEMPLSEKNQPPELAPDN